MPASSFRPALRRSLCAVVSSVAVATGASSPAPAATLTPDYDAKWGEIGGYRSASRPGPFTTLHHPERIRIVDDPAGKARKVARFSVYRSNTGATSDPRAQLELPHHIREGDEVWQGISVYFPRSFPSTVDTSSGDEFVTHTSMGSLRSSRGRAISFGSYGGTFRFGARLSQSGTYAWALTPRRRAWYDIVIHTKVSRSRSLGYLEIWLNRGSGYVKQRLTNTGSGGTFGAVSGDGRRWRGATTNGRQPLDSRLALYYSAKLRNAPNPLRMYFGPAKWRKERPRETDADNLAAVNPGTFTTPRKRLSRRSSVGA